MMQLVRKLARKCSYTVLVLALTMSIFATAPYNELVSADACMAQLGSPITSMQQYYNSNVGITVPVSAACSFFGYQLYAVGTAYDTSYNSNVGTANTGLSPVAGGNTFSGQLVFNLPASVQGHMVQFSVSIYNGQYGYYNNAPYYGQYYNSGSLLTTATVSYQVNSGYYPNYPYYYNNPSYPNYPNYPYSNYPNNPNYPYNNYNQGRNNYYYYYGRSIYGSCRYYFHFSGRYYCVYR